MSCCEWICSIFSRENRVFPSNLNKILHDIRNFRQLTPDQLYQIRYMAVDEYMEIIDVYGSVIEQITSIIDNESSIPERRMYNSGAKN